MPPRIDTPPIHTNGRVATASGILLPPSQSYGGSSLAAPADAPVMRSIIERLSWWNENPEGFQPGLALDKHERTGFTILPPKGSGIDDLVSQMLVDGRLANAGISPILSGQISAILNRQQAQARNSEITLSGRTYPVKNAKNAISRYNDSPLGYTGAISQVIYQMRTYNRGAPHATVPIIYPFEQWAENGLTAVPMPREGEAEGDVRYFYLEVDWQRYGTPVPFLPSVFDLEPTGNKEWPYWYRFIPTNDGKARWILLHWSQIIQVIPGHSGQGGIGTASAYICWDFLCDLILEKQRRAEKIVHHPTDGLLALSGVDQSPQEIKQQLLGERKEQLTQGRMQDKGFSVVTGANISAEFLSFREKYAEFEQFRQYIEDNIAQFFEEPLIAVVARGNVGFGVQSDVAAETTADGGVHSILTMVSMVLGQIYQRVSIVIARPNDPTKQRQLANLQAFAQTIGPLSTILSVEELRAMMHANVMQIPTVAGDNTSQTATVDEAEDREGVNDDEQTDTAAATEDEELAAWVNALVLEARSILRMATIDDALTSDEYFRFYELVSAGLTAQYEASDIAAIVAEARAQGVEDDLDQLAAIVADHTPPASDSTDTEELALLLLLLSILGRQDAEQQAFDWDERELTNAQRSAVDADGERYGQDRITSLYTGNPPGAVVEVDDEGRSPLDSPWAEQTLDVYSYAELAGFVRRGMRETADDSLVPAFVAALIPGAVAVRTARIADFEGGRVYNGGFSRGGRATGATAKRWLLTTARRPRDVHLRQVGAVVGIEERFPDGSVWPGELPMCQCGVELIYD